MKGSTGVCVFDGIMKAPLYIQILENTLLPFLRDVFPNGHRFMQDNDPKHTSRLARQFMLDNDVHWWKTPPESPDANPIENMWHELKEYIRREVKPKTKQDYFHDLPAVVTLQIYFKISKKQQQNMILT